MIGIDLTKSVIQSWVWMNDGIIAFNYKISWLKFLDIIYQFPAGSIITMGACATRIAGAHFSVNRL